MENIDFTTTNPSASTYNTIIDCERCLTLIKKLEQTSKNLELVDEKLTEILNNKKVVD